MIRLNSISIFWHCISRLTVSLKHHLPFNQQELEKRLEEVDLGMQRGEVLSRKDRPWKHGHVGSPAEDMEVENGSLADEFFHDYGRKGGWWDIWLPSGYGDLHKMQIQKKCSFFYLCNWLEIFKRCFFVDNLICSNSCWISSKRNGGKLCTPIVKILGWIVFTSYSKSYLRHFLCRMA